MSDELINQRPSNEQGSSQNQNQDLSRRDDASQRGLSSYRGGWLSPFDMMRRFSEDVDRMFGSLGFCSLGWPFETGRSLTSGQGTTGISGWSPSIDITTRGDDLLVSADLPGIKPEDVKIEADNNALILSGE